MLNDLYKDRCGEDLLNGVADGDTNAGKILNRLWEHCVLLACSGHLNKNLGIHVVNYASKRGGVKKVTQKCNCPSGTNHRFAPPTSQQKASAARVSYGVVFLWCRFILKFNSLCVLGPASRSQITVCGADQSHACEAIEARVKGARGERSGK